MGTRTCTVMFTDLAGYTAAVARIDRAGLRRLISQHEEVVAPIVRRHHGRVVKNLGDSFMCLFESATDALRATLDLQDAVIALGSMTLRMGLNTGDVEEIDGDAFGDAVNQAARILAMAPGGEIWFGPGTRACMNAAEIPWEEVGRFPLKGIAGGVDLQRVVHQHRCWLPEPLLLAARHGRLVRIRRGQATDPRMPADPIVLLEGFVPGSVDLGEAIGRLPVLDPASMYLAAWHVSPADRHAWLAAGRGLVIGAPAALERALAEAVQAVSRNAGTDTIVLEGGTHVELVLVIAGLALPAVPLHDVVASYAYDLLHDGRWVNQSELALVRVEMTPDGPQVTVTSTGVTIDGRSRALNEVVPLRDGMRVGVRGSTHTYRALDPTGPHGHVGVLLADTAMRLGVVEGQPAELGREPHHPGLAFPDRKGHANIRWCSGSRSSRARASGFTLDRALAGRRQASVLVIDGQARLASRHDRCTTWLLRADARVLERVVDEVPVAVGDHVVVGTTVVGLRSSDDA